MIVQIAKGFWEWALALTIVMRNYATIGTIANIVIIAIAVQVPVVAGAAVVLVLVGHLPMVTITTTTM